MFIDYKILIAILAVVSLFIFSLQKFSSEIRDLATKRFRILLKKITSTPIRGVLAGGIFTSIVQSSSATTVILIGLVNAGLLSVYESLGIIFGANIGTTITSQLISLHLTYFAPVFVVLGFAIGAFNNKYRVLGKALFYFGLIFFSLSLLSDYLSPLSSNPQVMDFFARMSTNILLAILIGFAFTAVVQSSSVTTGIAVVLVGTGLLSFMPALGIIFGANIGTTITAVLASISLNGPAKRVAIAHALFNIIGVLVMLPFITPFSNLVIALGGTSQQQIANAHLLFNVFCTVLFLIFIKPFYSLVKAIPLK